jgi:two-component system, LytTR family, response regulator
MMTLRIVIADDERPARRFLSGIIKGCRAADIVGEAASGEEAIALIERTRPHLALLDLQMPEVGGLDVVRRLPADRLPLVAFVTAFDDFAIEAFELNAIDYVLKPARKERVQATLDRARARLDRPERAEVRAAAVASAAATYERAQRGPYLERIPVRRREEVLLLPVRQVACIVAEGELLHLTTVGNERYTITHRLHALEARLDPRRFVRLSRGTLANVDLIAKVSPMPGGTYTATLSNGHQLAVSRIQSRLLRDSLLKL